MQPRRLRPVAALTLALLAAPFLAATAVAAQTGTPERRVVSHKVSLISVTIESARTALDRVKLARVKLTAAETVAPPQRQAPPPAVRATPPSTTPPPPPPSNLDDKATWIWPGDGPVTSPYGRRWGRMHAGVDIDAAYGSAVVAAQRGTVISAGWGQTGYGQVVQIDHGNGVTTLYAHLSTVEVAVGQVIAQGTRIGAVGKTGSVTAAHLHYEVHIGGAPTNPMPWLTSTDHSMQGHPG